MWFPHPSWVSANNKIPWAPVPLCTVRSSDSAAMNARSCAAVGTEKSTTDHHCCLPPWYIVTRRIIAATIGLLSISTVIEAPGHALFRLMDCDVSSRAKGILAVLHLNADSVPKLRCHCNLHLAAWLAALCR